MLDSGESFLLSRRGSISLTLPAAHGLTSVPVGRQAHELPPARHHHGPGEQGARNGRAARTGPPLWNLRPAEGQRRRLVVAAAAHLGEVRPRVEAALCKRRARCGQAAPPLQKRPTLTGAHAPVGNWYMPTPGPCNGWTSEDGESEHGSV
eukprot:scaffold2045_cov404-Prasinococcus_capsulatus_cf.AAC.19